MGVGSAQVFLYFEIPVLFLQVLIGAKDIFGKLRLLREARDSKDD